MDSRTVIVLIKTHLRDRTLNKGSRLSIQQLGPQAYSILKAGIAVPARKRRRSAPA